MVVTSPSAAPAPPAAAPGRPHPTYTKMITYALAQLGGASARSAIAGFIAARFTGLPVSHDALLSAHLRRLVAEGVLCTSGFSYLFSDDSQSPARLPESSSDVDSDDPSGFQSSSSDDDDDAYTPLLHVSVPVSVPVPVPVPVLGEKRGRGRPRKSARKVVVTLSGDVKGEQSGDVVTNTKRGRGRPRKQRQPSPSPVCGGIKKRGRGRPRKEEQQPQVPTPPASRWGFKVGCGRPMLASSFSGRGRPIIIENQPPAPRWSEIKRMYSPSAAAAMSAETGDTTPAPETGDAASMGIKESPAAAMSGETGDAASAAGIKIGGVQPHVEKPTPAELTGGAASTGIKRGRGRPRKDKPAAAAAMSAQAGDAGSAGIKRGRGRPRKDKPAAAAAAAMLAQTQVSTGMEGALANPVSGYVVSTGTKGALENPTTEKPSTSDIVSMVMKRGPGRPRKQQPAFD